MIKFIGLKKSRIPKDKTLDTLHYLKLQVQCEETEYRELYCRFKHIPEYIETIDKQHQLFLLGIDKELDNIEELL